jgi:hypothetical protein
VGDHKSKMNIIQITSPYMVPVRALTRDRSDLASEQGSVFFHDKSDGQGMLTLC